MLRRRRDATPPMVSNLVKKDGVPLYRLARKGIEAPHDQ